jgi:hypothetical protein
MGPRQARANARRIKGATARVEQQPYDYVPAVRTPRPAAGMADGYCQLSAALGPATGTWPDLTPTTTTATVYSANGNGLTSLAAMTVYNFRNVTWAASKTTYLVFNGGIWKIVDQDC